MKATKKAGKTLLTAMCLLSSLALTGCWKTAPVVVLPENRVQKISAGESADFDGYLFTSGAAARLLEIAERCKVVK